MHIPQNLVITALKRIWEDGISTGDSSILETFLVAKYLAARNIAPNISTVNSAVDELFVDFKDHPQGRIQLFRSTPQGTPNWKDAKDSGRKTVWNYGTRHRGQKLFEDDHFSKGLLNDLSIALQQINIHKIDPVDLSIVLLRNQEVDSLDPKSLVSQFKDFFDLSDAELSFIARMDEPNWEERSLNGDGPIWDPNNMPDSWKPSAIIQKNPSEFSKPQKLDIHSLEDTTPITVESRIMRMLELSVASHNAVVAVGPPGTGKTTLLEQLVNKATSQPESVGLQVPPGRPIIVTPDESWTTRELVGGETIVGGEVKFAPGHILEAIKEDRWLILDEINRADMDRIFGSLFTWLSGKPVTVGTFKTATGNESIILGWSGKPESEIVTNSSATEYLAGDDWRLLGTYNAVDSAKVFRFGQALGRRFIRVPIPAAPAESIDSALTKICSGLPDIIKEKILNLYRCHIDVSPLGPALFLRMPKYLQASNVDWLTSESSVLSELLAESYVINLGPYLSKLDDLQAEDIKRSVIYQYSIFSEVEWEWIWKLSQNMSS